MQTLTARSRDESGLTMIELLVVTIIMSIVSTMLLITWFALQRSNAYSIYSSEARDSATLAVSRMTREIRDLQTPGSAYISACGLPTTTPAFVRSRQTWVAFFTTFNAANASSPTASPRLVLYVLYPDGKLWRYADVNADGKNSSASGKPSWSSSLSNPGSNEAVETTTWEGAQLIVANVVNPSVRSGAQSSTDLFRYDVYDNNGTIQQDSPILGDDNRSGVIGVEIRLLVDLNPGRSPTYIDLRTTAQPRNARQL
jgi:prepilin-type N-terminal cleavage/methylation domain-containing protein